MSALDSIHRQLEATRALRPLVDPLACVDPLVQLPPDVVVRSGAYVPAGVSIEPGCHIGPNAAFVDGKPTVLRRGVQVGANATIHAGVTLAAGAVVRPGAVVTRSVPRGAIVEGNPAQIVGYVPGTQGAVPTPLPFAGRDGGPVEALPVRGVTIHRFPVVPDLRGNLTVGEFQRQVPFEPQRWFVVYDVPAAAVRGEHAHKSCHEFLVCLRGSCAVVCDDGRERVEVVLDAPNRGLHLPPLTWRYQHRYSADAVLLVFASHLYDTGDYYFDYDEFLRAARADGAEAA